jgi:predicted DNA-binding protein
MSEGRKPALVKNIRRSKYSLTRLYPKDINLLSTGYNQPSQIAQGVNMGRHRMILSLSDELHSILMELSKETGTPAATFVVELLESSKPHIMQISEAVKHAKNQQKAQALKTLSKMACDATSQLNDFQQKLDEEENNGTEKKQ